MVNQDRTGSDRQSRLRQERNKWLAEYAHGLSTEGLIGALMRGECSLTWARVPAKRRDKPVQSGAKSKRSKPANH